MSLFRLRRAASTAGFGVLISSCVWLVGGISAPCARGELLAGTGKADITRPETVTKNERLWVKALAIRDDKTAVVIITVDAVSIGEIGSIPNSYLGAVRGRLAKEFSIPPTNLLFNASHCHGTVCEEIEERTVEAARAAWKNLTPVRVGVGAGSESRISENRRLKLKSGKEADVRHAYSLPPDEEVAGVGPIDPEIGVLRLDRVSGGTLAIVYNFACHPIQGVPSGANTADFVGFASRAIEENSGDGSMAFFLQGCGGDINPVLYKAVDVPRDAEPLGNLLGLSTLKASHAIDCESKGPLAIRTQTLALPRSDLGRRIMELETEQIRLLRSLRGTSLNLRTFLPLAVKYSLSGDFPSYYSHHYLHETMIGDENLKKLDANNREGLAQYIRNIHIMEELTRVQTNLALLEKHQAQFLEAAKRTIDVEVSALRIGDFRLITFPGELTVEIGLGIKKRAPHPKTFVAGYTNGYIYYCPTAEQLANVGGAQEDSDCILAPEWQEVFEARVGELLEGF